MLPTLLLRAEGSRLIPKVPDMNEATPNSPDREELYDRLIDRALSETLGGQAPPDLSSAIHEKMTQMNSPALPAEYPSDHSVAHRSARRRWSLFAIAASLLIGTGWLLIPSQQAAREAARRSAVKKQLANGPEGASAVPSAGDLAVLEKLPQRDAGSLSGKKLTSPGGHRPSETFSDGKLPAAAPISDKKETAELKRNAAVLNHNALVGREPVSPSPAAKPVAIAQDKIEPAASKATTLSIAAQSALPTQTRLYDLNSNGQAQGQILAYGDLSGRRKERYDQSQLHDYFYLGGEGRGLQQESELGGLGNNFGFAAEGIGPGAGGDRYARIVENSFKAISTANADNRLSTFSIDVDTASYANVRQFLMQSHTLPPPDAVRIEELVNYFDYHYSPPTGDVPFAANVELAACPWAPKHRLARIGIKGREMERTRRPQSNLVFLIDVSGSMDEPNKLPLLLEGMKLLTRELGENDRVAIVVYASSEGLALSSTHGTDQSKILAALDQLKAGGSTAGGAGIQLAYQVAADNFIKGGVNRVILCTDGDFNVGVTSPAELERMAETKAKDTGVFLTVLGFGRGNLNDAMMEQIADKGNGNYHYVDSLSEARKVLVEEMAGTLVTIAKDVKIQVEFNPAKVAGYRLIGYENRTLAAEDFNNDKKDAGEIGAGHTVTALYEIVPAGQKVDAADVDALKYGTPAESTSNVEPKEKEEGADDKKYDKNAASDELLTLKIRYKQPDGDKSTKLEFPVADAGEDFGKATADFKFASAVASFGMLLRNSQYKGNATYAAVAEIAQSTAGDRDPHGYRKEFVEMVKRAKELAGEEKN